MSELAEGSRDPGAAVDQTIADVDAEALRKEVHDEDDESDGEIFKTFFAKRNKAQIKATLKKYEKVIKMVKSRKTVERALIFIETM